MRSLPSPRRRYSLRASDCSPAPLPATPPIAASATAWEAHSLTVTTRTFGYAGLPASSALVPANPNAAAFCLVSGASHSNPSMAMSRQGPRNAPAVSSSATGTATSQNSAFSGSYPSRWRAWGVPPDVGTLHESSPQPPPLPVSVTRAATSSSTASRGTNAASTPSDTQSVSRPPAVTTPLSAISRDHAGHQPEHPAATRPGTKDQLRLSGIASRPRLWRPCLEFPARHEGRVRTAIQPLSAGFELAVIQEAYRSRFLAYTFPSRSPRPAHPAVPGRRDFVEAAPALPGDPRSEVGPRARCRCCYRSFPAGPLPHPPCGSHRNGRSACLCRWSAAGEGCCRCRGPWGRDVASAIAVALHGDAGRAGEHGPVPGEPPPLVAEAIAELFHPETVLALVLAAYPAHQPQPCVAVDRAEHRLGHSVPEVVRPARQGPVQAADQLVEILVAG